MLDCQGLIPDKGTGITDRHRLWLTGPKFVQTQNKTVGLAFVFVVVSSSYLI
jgi:hypothetical protein